MHLKDIELPLRSQRLRHRALPISQVLMNGLLPVDTPMKRSYFFLLLLQFVLELRPLILLLLMLLVLLAAGIGSEESLPAGH